MIRQDTKLVPETIRDTVKAKGPTTGWRSDGIESRARLLVGLHQLAGDKGTVTLTQEQIAHTLGFKRRTVEALLGSLTEAGALEHTPRTQPRAPATYRLRPEWFELTATPTRTHSIDSAAQATNRTQRVRAGHADQKVPTDLPWQRAIDQVRSELGTQIQHLARQVQFLTDRLGADRLGAVGTSTQGQDDEGQPEAAVAQTEKPVVQDADLGQALIDQMDARLEAFAVTLVNRLEQLIRPNGSAGHQDIAATKPTAPDEGETTSATDTAQQTDAIHQSTYDRESETSAGDEHTLDDDHTDIEGDAIEEDAHDLSDHAELIEVDLGDVLTGIEQTQAEFESQATPTPARQTPVPEPSQPLQALATKRKPGRPPKDPAALNRLEARADLLFEQIAAILHLQGLEQATALINLARAELDWQSQHYTGDDGLPVWTTILKTNLRITKTRLLVQATARLLTEIPVDQLEGHLDDQPLIKLIKLWGNTYDTAVEEHTTRINQDYRHKAREQALDPIPVDISGWLKLAKNTLEGVAQGKKVQWEAVSFALALSTGRRQAEVHCTGQLLPVDNLSAGGNDIAAVKAGYAVLFAGRGDRLFGQTKTRPGTEAEREWRARPTRTLPTLLPAELVIQGWQWLERHRHKVEHEDKVNGNFNGKLRTFMAKTAPAFTYKNLRDFYAVACWRNWLRDGVPETSLPERLKEVLGHGPLGDATPSYRKFCLTGESISRI